MRRFSVKFLLDVRHILRLAWPVLVGQLAVIAFGVIDTVMVARVSADDLAALALGSSIYISVYVSLMGVIQALTPIAAQHFGAVRYAEIGEDVRQAAWLALALTIIGMTVLLLPQGLLSISRASPVLQDKATHYLQILSVGLPASLLFRVYSALNNAISRPKMVTALQLCGLVLKLPLNYWLIFGGLGVPALGAPGCAIASVLVYWTWLVVGLMLLRHNAAYHMFSIFTRASWPDLGRVKAMLALGIPMGLSYLIEITAFAFMALFIARLGSDALAGHQIAANLGTVLYMLPLSLAIATSTLVAQALGSQQFEVAKRIGLNGIRFSMLLASVVGLSIWFTREPLLATYTPDPRVASAALPLLGFIAIYQIFDALQIMSGFILRAYKIAFVPMLIYAVSLWGIGLGGGYYLGFNVSGDIPPAMTGASGFWMGNCASLALASVCLLAYLVRVRQPRTR